MNTQDCVISGDVPASIILTCAGVQVTVLEKHAEILRNFRRDTGVSYENSDGESGWGEISPRYSPLPATADIQPPEQPQACNPSTIRSRSTRDGFNCHANPRNRAKSASLFHEPQKMASHFLCPGRRITKSHMLTRNELTQSFNVMVSKYSKHVSPA